MKQQICDIYSWFKLFVMHIPKATRILRTIYIDLLLGELYLKDFMGITSLGCVFLAMVAVFLIPILSPVLILLIARYETEADANAIWEKLKGE